MIGDTLVIILPLAALILAGLSIAGIWYWWTTTHDEEEDGAPYLSEPETAPVKKQEEPVRYQSDDGELQGSFFDRLRDSFKPVGGDRAPSPPTVSSTPVPARANLAMSAPATPVGDAVEVMRIMRDLADGSLIVEINGQRYRRLTEITDAQIGRRFLGNAQALARFARLGDISIPEEQEDLPFIADTPVPPSAISEPELPPMPPAPSPQPAATSGWREATTGGSSGDADAETEAKSMPEQIEELLQFRLARTPEMAHRSIHVRPAMDGGVRIEVDGKYFDGVGSVTDTPVREFIQTTIREWEARQ